MSAAASLMSRDMDLQLLLLLAARATACKMPPILFYRLLQSRLLACWTLLRAAKSLEGKGTIVRLLSS